MIKIDILTLFPDMFAPMDHSMMWKARDRSLLDLQLHDMRDWSSDSHRSVDDTPYGGGGGMVLRADIVVPAVEAIRGQHDAPVIMMTPQGRRFDHSIALELGRHPHLILLCGHYEGFDERIRQLVVTDEISIGDYVLTGGELAAMVVVDALVRQLPGVLGAETGAAEDSFADGLLEGAHYTRPAVYRGLTVPAMLTSGNHAAIATWRRRDTIRRTWQRRPELLRDVELSREERHYLAELAIETATRRREAQR